MLKILDWFEMIYKKPEIKISKNRNDLVIRKLKTQVFEENRDEIIDVYTNGCATIRELSKYIERKFSFLISTASIHKFLHDNNVYMRMSTSRYLTSREEELNICKDYLDTRNTKTVGKKYGLSHVTVSWIVRAYGIKTGHARHGKRRIR